ncbi:MAG: plastocyanin [Betaproteobacteria bacterium HGW-Betaproteobacteria-21]|nr:MAG: plastocyanin [Betaproteobacteria bacterium HGW-Betaproteobacteria-21]
MKSRRRFLSAGIAGSLLVLSRGAYAHVAAPHGEKKPAPVEREQQEWGIAGEEKDVTRTVPIVMTDAMRFIPDRIEVRLGETIRFTHRNEGKVMHEMVIGTPEALAEHAELMVKFPGMEHDEPWMAHVEPGGSGEIVWTFNRAGTFEFACLIPGHFQAGMIGKLIVS